MLNPRLEINQSVKHQDGRVGTIADTAHHRQSRLVSVDGQVAIETWKLKSIAATKINGEWHDCKWVK